MTRNTKTHSAFYIPHSAFFLLALAASVLAQSGGGFDVKWHTIEGGAASSTSGSLVLSGTIGQHDAGSPATPLAGGNFKLVGGFWPVTQVCYCPGDLNGDGKKDGRDIQQFVNCVLLGGNCSCADMDLANGINLADVPVFVNSLLTSAACP